MVLSVLVLAVAAVPAGAQMGVWRDVNPTAYIQPPANPNLDSVYMLSATEGWAVSDSLQTTNTTTGLPGIFHYDGSTWNLVPAPRFPDFPSRPSIYNLTSVSFGPPNNPISRNDGWAVGYNLTTTGIIGTPCGTGTPGIPATCSVALHWDGVAWRVQTAGLSTANAGQLWSVSMVSSTDVWAVGQNSGGQGVFWHWTGVAGLGGGWNLPQAPTAGPTPLFSVFMVGPTEGWAVGAGGVIFHYIGGAWTSFPSPVATALRSVFMISPTEGWAVGDGGVILHYIGGIWTGPVSPGTTLNQLVSVFMVSSSEGWAVGIAGTIVHFAGGAWTSLSPSLVPTSPVPLLDFHAAYFNSASDGWVTGNFGVILHFDGSNFGAVTSPTLHNFTSISFGPPLTGPANPNDGWAVGNASVVAPFEPTIYHWNGFMWTKGVAIGATNDLNSVFMVNTGDVWAVGGGPRSSATCAGAPGATPCPTILHFTGGAWNTITPPPGMYKLKSVFMVSATEGWAVGEAAGNVGIILHYTVTGGVGSWATFAAPAINGYGVALPSLNSAFMLGPNEGWAVGDNATILHYTVTGGLGTWNPVIVSGSPGLSRLVNLTSVFMLSPTSGWAVGGVALNPAGQPPTNVGAFATGPVILYWDGTKWNPVPAPQIPGGVSPNGLAGQAASVRLPTAILKSVYCTGAKDCWATGFPGKLLATILHWDGVAWNFVTLSPALLGQDSSLKGIPPILTSVYMTSPTSGWIVGSSFGGTAIPHALSTILRFAPFGGVFSTTLTLTQVSTVSTSTTLITGSTVSTSPISTNTTTTFSHTATGGIPPGGIPGFPVESIVAGIVVGLTALSLLRRRRAGRGSR